MREATKKVLQQLQQRNFRITTARRLVIEALATSEQPKTVAEVAQQTGVDVVSVYRTVELLRQEGWIEEFAVGTHTPRYAIQMHHHHHIICDTCQRVSHVACEKPVSVPALPESFARVEDHSITFYGVCIDCDRSV